MKSRIDRTSFFMRSSADSLSGEIRRELTEEHREKAVWAIQRWWKQLHLKQTATESFHYVHDMVSLEHAQHESFPQLEKFLLDPKTQSTTRKLLMRLEQTKDIVLPSRVSLSNVYHTERQFLSAYLIATKSKFLFETPTDIDALLLSRAEEMLKSFEDLCAYMGDIYLKEDSDSSPLSTSPIAERTPSVDRVLASIGSKRMKNDRLFITAGRDYLETFHKNQMAYYETFFEWESNNRYKLAQILIVKYLEIEARRFKALNSLDPRMLEFYEGYGCQQETLRKRIRSLLGEEGNRMLSDELNKLQISLEARKWVNSPEEVFIHELALNPQLVLPLEACVLRPQRNIDVAITALMQKTPDVALIIDVLEEIRNLLALFTPNNRQQIARLQQVFGREAITTQIEAMGLRAGLYNVIYSLIEQIKDLESPAYVLETNAFLNDISRRISEEEDASLLLRDAIDFIYRKMSQINLGINNFYINQARGTIARNIVALEQQKFQMRLAEQQFNLEFTLNWIDKFVSSPEAYRLNVPLLCSKYQGTYITHALLICVLQQPQSSVLRTIPETFYLDRLRLVNWHAQYQNILYVATALSYLEMFCQDHSIRFAPEQLLAEKKRLITLLEKGALRTPKERADDLIAVINGQLAMYGKELSLIDKRRLISLIEKSCLGTNDATLLINKRLGDQLSYYFFKGRLPEHSTPLVMRYGLDAELNKLGKEVIPVLRLHTKVHGAFYQQQIELRLWKPLFVMLKQKTITEPLPSLLLPEEEAIKNTHAYLHKFAFVLTGLALIQQTVVYSDMWNLKLTVKNATLKELANSFGLVEMIRNPDSTKDAIENRLMELMQHVAHEQELPFDVEDRNKMAHMLRLVKNEKSLGCKAFLDELIAITKQTVIERKEPDLNPNNLLAEFKEEVTQVGVSIKQIVGEIKNTHVAGEVDPVIATIPLLRTGRATHEMQFKM